MQKRGLILLGLVIFSCFLALADDSPGSDISYSNDRLLYYYGLAVFKNDESFNPMPHYFSENIEPREGFRQPTDALVAPNEYTWAQYRNFGITRNGITLDIVADSTGDSGENGECTWLARPLLPYNEDSENKINAGFPSREIILKPGKNTIEFSIEEANETGLYMIEIGKYAFPAYIFVEEANGRQIGKKPMLRFEPERIASIMLIGEKSAYPFQIVNFGDWDVGDIEIDYDENIFSIDRETIGLKAKEGIELNASFIGDISEEMKIKGISRIITARAGGYAFELPVVINFTEKQEEAKTPYLNNYTRLSYCSELKGKVCVAEENCTGETKTSLDGACCVGACAKKEIESGNYSWIGWLIAGIVLLVIIYAYLRYKKAKGTDKFAEITGS